MSLTKVSMNEIVKRLYVYKLKAYIQVFMSLVILQVIAILFSLNGVGQMGSGGGMINVNVGYYSADLVVAFTMLWGFITAILITTKAYRNDDFILVTNRISSNLSNMLFLLTASVIGGIMAVLSTYLLKVIVLVFINDFYLNSTFDSAGTMDMLVGTCAAILYVFLVSLLGYLAGTLVQLNRLFVVLLPTVFIGGLLFDGMRGKAGIIMALFEFFFTESSFPLFLIKVICTVALVFSGTFMLSNRMEVRS